MKNKSEQQSEQIRDTSAKAGRGREQNWASGTVQNQQIKLWLNYLLKSLARITFSLFMGHEKWLWP